MSLSVVAKKAAWGPPKPIGTPKRWALPTTMSAPSAPGSLSSTRPMMSATTQVITPRSRAVSISGARSRTRPPSPGYCSRAPKTSCSASSSAGATTSSKPNQAARVRTTSSVWGKTSSATKKVLLLAFLLARLHSAIASAAAVASSSSEALASSMPVRSITICWKLSRASRRPWEISGW